MGKDTARTAQPTSGVLTGLAPRPPKAILPNVMQIIAPRMTSHQGASAGSRKAKMSPAYTAVKSSTSICRPMAFSHRASTTTQAATLRDMTRRAGRPQFQIAMAAAGKQQRMVKRLYLRMVRPQCQKDGTLMASRTEPDEADDISCLPAAHGQPCYCFRLRLKPRHCRRRSCPVRHPHPVLFPWLRRLPPI